MGASDMQEGVESVGRLVGSSGDATELLEPIEEVFSQTVCWTGLILMRSGCFAQFLQTNA